METQVLARQGNIGCVLQGNIYKFWVFKWLKSQILYNHQVVVFYDEFTYTVASHANK